MQNTASVVTGQYFFALKLAYIAKIYYLCTHKTTNAYER